MECILYISTSPLSIDQLQEVVRSVGGTWNNDVTFNHGLLKDPSGTAFVNKPSDPNECYDPTELGELASKLGGKAHTVICVDFGTGDSSALTALQFCKLLVRSFGGGVDGNGVIDDWFPNHVRS